MPTDRAMMGAPPTSQLRKAEPAPGYPPEEGCYLRGNDYSPVAVLVILRWIREETPPEIEDLVRVGVESGAALSGTLQTENIGLEKVISNIVANPNIRYLIVCGPESPGHLVGETILALMEHGIDERKRIIGASAPRRDAVSVSFSTRVPISAIPALALVRPNAKSSGFPASNCVRNSIPSNAEEPRKVSTSVGSQ